MNNGDTLAQGKYTILALLGEGGMGKVYKACERSSRIVAIKVLNNQGFPAHRERFLQEMEALRKAQGPGVVEIFDQGSEGNMLYLVMEYLEGETLAQRIVRGPLNRYEALRIMIEVAQAISRGHSLGIVHRDLKPENIFLPFGEGSKVLDFGIAKLAQRESLQAMTKTGELFGTPFYMSLNMFEQGAKNADTRDDAWAMSAILYEMLTGVQAYPCPFDRIAELLRSRSSLPPRLPVFDHEEAIWGVISKGLSLDRRAQYESAAEFLKDLKATHQEIPRTCYGPAPETSVTQALQQAPPPPNGHTEIYSRTAYAPPPVDHPSPRAPNANTAWERQNRRQRLIGALILVMVVLVLGGGSIFLLAFSRADRTPLTPPEARAPAELDAGTMRDAGPDAVPEDIPNDARRRSRHRSRRQDDIPTVAPMATPPPIEPTANPVQRTCRETMVPNNTIARNLRNPECRLNVVERYNLCNLIDQRGYIVDCEREDDLRTLTICRESNMRLREHPNCQRPVVPTPIVMR